MMIHIKCQTWYHTYDFKIVKRLCTILSLRFSNSSPSTLTPYFRNLEGRIIWDKRVIISENIGFLVLKLRRFVDDIIGFRTDNDLVFHLLSFLLFFTFFFIFHCLPSLLSKIFLQNNNLQKAIFQKIRAKTLNASMRTCNHALLCTDFWHRL